MPGCTWLEMRSTERKPFTEEMFMVNFKEGVGIFQIKQGKGISGKTVACPSMKI
jgi:hypothetical protein